MSGGLDTISHEQRKKPSEKVEGVLLFEIDRRSSRCTAHRYAVHHDAATAHAAMHHLAKILQHGGGGSVITILL